MIKTIYLTLFIQSCIYQHIMGQKTFSFPEPEIIEIREDGIDVAWTFSEAVSAYIQWHAVSSVEHGFVSLTEKDRVKVWKFDQGKPASFYRARISIIYPGDTIHGPFHVFSTRSLSKGKIQVYFNHPVSYEAAGKTRACFVNKTLDDSLISFINKAKETIDMAIYNGSYASSFSGLASALNNAVQRGIQVRIIYNASSSNSLITKLSPVIGKLPSKIGEPYGLMHNKFMIIDADAEDPDQSLVWTGSANWIPEQMDGPDENNVVLIRDQALARAYKTEFEEMYGGSGPFPNPTKSRFGYEKQDNTPHVFLVGGIKVRCYFSPSDQTNKQILDVLNSASNDIEFASMVITRYDLAGAIEDKIQKGLEKVSGIIDDSSASYPAPIIWKQLKGSMGNGELISHNGFPGFMHHKFMIADATNSASDPQVLTGSHNWTYAAEEKNDENTIIIHDPVLSNEFYQAFSWLKQQHGRYSGLADFSEEKIGFCLYPNPFHHHLKLIFKDNSSGTQIILRKIQGESISTFNIDKGQREYEFDLSFLEAGIYFMEIQGKSKGFIRLIHY